MITEILALLKELLPLLKPILSPTEYDRITRLIVEWETLAEKTYAEFASALAALDIPALNSAFAVIAGRGRLQA